TGWTATQTASQLASAINGNAGMSAEVTASNVAGNTFQIIADEPGTPFSVALGGNGSSQLDLISIPAALPTLADTASFQIGATTLTVTGPLLTQQAVRDALVLAINANPTLAAQVTAIADPGDITRLYVQADTPGAPFTATLGGTSAPVLVSSDAPSS